MKIHIGTELYNTLLKDREFNAETQAGTQARLAFYRSIHSGIDIHQWPGLQEHIFCKGKAEQEWDIEQPHIIMVTGKRRAVVRDFEFVPVPHQSGLKFYFSCHLPVVIESGLNRHPVRTACSFK